MSKVCSWRPTSNANVGGAVSASLADLYESLHASAGEFAISARNQTIGALPAVAATGVGQLAANGLGVSNATLPALAGNATVPVAMAVNSLAPASASAVWPVVASGLTAAAPYVIPAALVTAAAYGGYRYYNRAPTAPPNLPEMEMLPVSRV